MDIFLVARKNEINYEQCDQIGRYFGLWATFKAFGNN